MRADRLSVKALFQRFGRADGFAKCVFLRCIGIRRRIAARDRYGVRLIFGNRRCRKLLLQIALILMDDRLLLRRRHAGEQHRQSQKGYYDSFHVLILPVFPVGMGIAHPFLCCRTSNARSYGFHCIRQIRPKRHKTVMEL